MRDINRIPKFTSELENIWMKYYPDLRFSQLVVNFLNFVESKTRIDSYYVEDGICLKYLKEYAKKSPLHKENSIYE